MGPMFPEARKFAKSLHSHLVAILLGGILLMSLGVYLVGTHVPYGNLLLALSSFVVYASIIALALTV